MTEYTVKANASGAGGTLPTLAAAVKIVKPGDIVTIGEGVYRETPNLPAGTHWRVADGAQVVIDGGWNGKKQDTESGKAAVGLGEGASLTGVIIRNALGAGAIMGDNSLLRNCKVERSYANGVHLWRVKGARVEGCTISESCSRFTVGGQHGGASVAIVHCTDCVVEDNTIAYGYGEGIDIGRGSKGIHVVDNTVFDHKHVQIYFVRSQASVAEGNVVFHTGDARFLTRNGRTPGGIVFGDEGTDKMDEIAPMRANVVRGNLVVNMGGLLAARNNAPGHKDDSLYDTSLDADTVIEDNTFVAGPMTQDAVLIVPNSQGRPHGPARFRRNVVVGPASAPANFRYEANAWQPAAAAALRTDDDTAVALVNAAAAGTLKNQYPAVGHNLKLDDYRPVAGSALALGDIGALAAAGDVEPPPPDDDDEPTPVDWDALHDRMIAATLAHAGAGLELTTAREQVVKALAAHDAAMAELLALKALIDSYASAA